MNRLDRLFGNRDPEWKTEIYDEPDLPPAGPGVLDGLRGTWQWDELAAEVSQESQARVALVGLPDAGKSLLFNRIRGWVISPAAPRPEDRDRLAVESYGSFVLADLPTGRAAAPLAGNELVLDLGDPALVVYVVDGHCGVRQEDYRWVSLLRAGGRPVVVALNKCDDVDDVDGAVATASRRLGMPVLPISALSGLNVEERLLPAMLDAAPRLAVPLGREITALRRTAARRVIRQAALFGGLMSAQPIPMLDVPFQAMLQTGVVMRVGAAYGHTPAGGINRETLGAVAGALGAHTLAQSLLKVVPVLGWAVSGLLGAAATTLVGEAAIRYYEAGGTVPLRQWLRRDT